MAKKSNNKKNTTEKQKKANKAGTRNNGISRRAQYHKEHKDSTAPVIIQDWNNNLRGLYSDELLPLIEDYASQGLNNAQIADKLLIGNRTFYEWRNKYPQVALALAKYRRVADTLVENALYANCVGFTYQEQAATQKGTVVTLNKFKVGETKAQIYWLNNRRADRWKTKVETALTLPQDISGLAFAIKRREE